MRRTSRGLAVVAGGWLSVAVGGCCFGGATTAEPLPCHGNGRLDHGPTPGSYVLRGEIETAPGARAEVAGQLVDADDQGHIALDLTLEGDAVIGSTVHMVCIRNVGTFTSTPGTLDVTVVPHFSRTTDTTLHCERALCELIANGTTVSVTAPAGATVTVGDQSATSSGGELTLTFAAADLLQGVSLPDPHGQLFGDSPLVRAVTLAIPGSDPISGRLVWSNHAVLQLYASQFTGAAAGPITFEREGHHAAGLLFHEAINSPSYAVGQIRRVGDVGYIGVFTDVERRGSCGNYSDGAGHTVQLDRVMHDARLVVRNRLTGEEVATHTFEAPTPRCASEVGSLMQLDATYDQAAVERWFAEWVTRRAGGHLPTSDPDPLPTLPPLVGEAPTAGGPSSPDPSDPGPPVPDPTAASDLGPRVASLGYLVGSATTSIDPISGAAVRDVELSHPEKMGISLTITDYASDRRPGAPSRVAVRSSQIVVVQPAEGVTLSDADFRPLLAISATSTSALAAALTRAGWTVDEEATLTEDSVWGANELDANAMRGDDFVSVAIYDLRPIPRGGDDPHAYRVVGSVLYTAEGGDTRSDLDRVLAAVSR